MTTTKADLEARVAQLEAENQALREGRLARTTGVPLTPSFGMSEGERDEIERTGSAVSPFDGERKTVDDLPERVTVDPEARQGDPVTGPLVDYSAPPARDGE